jgi:hypothetical protein
MDLATVKEEYSIKLEVTKLTVNGPIMDDPFVLEPPSGAGIASRSQRDPLSKSSTTQTFEDAVG